MSVAPDNHDVTSAGSFPLFGSAFLPMMAYSYDCQMATIVPNHTHSQHQIRWSLPAPISLASRWLWSCYLHISKPITVSRESPIGICCLTFVSLAHSMSQYLSIVCVFSFRCWRWYLNCIYMHPLLPWALFTFLPSCIFLHSTHYILIHCRFYTQSGLSFSFCWNMSFTRAHVFACFHYSAPFVQHM